MITASLILMTIIAPFGGGGPRALGAVVTQEPAEASEAVRFTDITETSGISFRHVRGASGRKYLIETMGAGGGFADFDRDGRLDLYLVDSGPLPGYEKEVGPVVNRLFRSLGGERYADVTEVSGTGDDTYGMGSAVADFDNDGFPDLYVTNFGPDVLYRNNGDGTFTDVTEEAGIDAPLWGTSAAFGDVDADGWLDLYVANYVDFSLDNHKWCGDSVNDIRDYCDPDVYNGVPDHLFRNRGDGGFTDVAAEAGTDRSREAKGLGVVFGDYDNDGDVDIYVANDGVRNFLYRNDGSGTFEEVGLMTGVAYNESGGTEAGMGVDFGDIDGDGHLDIFVTNLDLETNTLYRNTGQNLFFDSTFPSNMGIPSLSHVGFGTAFFDYDNDTDLDVFIANGHILEDVLEQRGGDITWAQPNFLMRNDGTGRFENVGPDSGEAFSERKSSRGAAFGDIDNDGDVDVLVTNSADAPDLLRNDGGHRGHSLVIQLQGVRANRDGIDARLGIEIAGRRMIRDVKGGYSYESHHDPRMVVGLGGADTVDVLEIRWPGGRVETLRDVAADRRILVREGSGIVAARPLRDETP